MTTYPEAFDSDLELPRADNDVSELSADYINSLRDAVIAIQRVIGVHPQGRKSTFNDRINVSIDSNGYIKREALAQIGLVTLPISDIHIAPNAGIKESKIDLECTRQLKTMSDSLRTDFNGTVAGLASNTNASNTHYLGLANFHDGYHIKINTGAHIGVSGLEATTIGDAVNELSGYLISGNNTRSAHIDLGISPEYSHSADTISVDPSNFITIDRTASSVQDAFDKIDTSSGVFGTEHLDQFHSNGVIKEAKSGEIYNPTRLLYGPAEGVLYNEGSSLLKLPDVVSFTSLGVRAGDILKIHTQGGIVDSGSYQIKAIGPLEELDTLGNLIVLDADELTVAHTFVESRAPEDNIFVSIYKPASESTEYAPLACSVRHNETIVDTISILEPAAARAVSIGFNGTILNSDGYEIHLKVGIGNQQYRELAIPGLNRERLGVNQPEPVTSQTVAERINAYVSDPDLGHHFPVTAYRIGNELALAHNWVGSSDYTLEIKDGYSGNYALGFGTYGANVVDQEISGFDSPSYIVNGVKAFGVRQLFDGYASVSSTDELDTASTFALWTNDGQMINPLRSNIKAGSVMHVSGHEYIDSNGSYTLMASNETGVSVFSSDAIPVPRNPTTFNVRFTDSSVPLDVLRNSETNRGLVQIYVDSAGETIMHQKMLYNTSIGAGVEIIGTSNYFPAGDVFVLITLEDDKIKFNLIDNSIYGDTVSVCEEFQGSFKLYHPNGLDYFLVRVLNGTIPGGMVQVTVNDSLYRDEALLLCTGHFDGTHSINSLVDNRLFGNLGPDQVRSDFIEAYTQKPTAELRSDGVVRGFDLLDAVYFDDLANTQAVPLRGGIAYVNGVRVAVETQKVTIPSFDQEGLVLDDARRLIAINEFGSIQLVSDELGEVLFDGYTASAAYGRLLPLYYVTIVDGGISSLIDVRRFINRLDDKLELIVDETNNVVGNFRTLEGALLFAEKFPGKEKLTIRVINAVSLENNIVVPDGVSIIGGSPMGGSSKHQIINYSATYANLITLSGNNTLKDVEIISPEVSLQGALVYVSGPNVRVENCVLRFGEDITSNHLCNGIEVGPLAIKDVLITNNRIDNVYSGIVSQYGSEQLTIKDNIIYNISGTGGNSYGIRAGSGNREIQQIRIEDNVVEIPSIVTGTDIRGISFDTGFNTNILRISRNNVIHEAQNTVTNGIRIDVLDGYTGAIDQLFITDNVVDGVSLDDNFVFGIYIANTNHCVVRGNTLLNIGVADANRIDTAAIRLATNFGIADISNNIIKDSDVLRGIEVEYQEQNSRVNINNNTIMNIGTSAHYIRGSSPNSNISDNNIVGPGAIGIRWNGTNTKISGNLLNRPNTLTVGDTTFDYAFEEYAIYVPVSDVDITNNSITGMIFDEHSIGISNGGAGRDRLKIINNTLHGSFMSKMVHLYGSGHVVNNNKFHNEVLPDADTTICIELSSVNNSMIMGNSFDGTIGVAINSSGTTVSELTIANNVVIAETINISSIKLDGTTENCFIMGNKIPNGSTEDNTVGTSPLFDVYNTNLMGVNLGLNDTRGVHASSGASGYETVVPDGYAGVAHWALKGTNDYWEINRAAANDPRNLYFPINEIPNGAALTAVKVQGSNGSTSIGTFTGQLFKRSVKAAGLVVTPISDIADFSSATSDFGNSLTIGQVSINTVGGEIVNYEESNYYLKILHQSSYPGDEQDIRVYGVTIYFTY